MKGVKQPSKPKGPVHAWETDLSPQERAKLDPQVRLILSLIKVKDFQQLYLRMGIAQTAGGPGYSSLPLLVELELAGAPGPESKSIEIWFKFFQRFNCPPGYLLEFERNPQLRQVTARIKLDPEIYDGKTKKLEAEISALLASARRVSLAVPIPPSGDASLRDIALPVDRMFRGKHLTGKGAIVGIIDDGCALAHWNFLKKHRRGRPVKSRILYLWDPARTKGGNGWTPPQFSVAPKRPVKLGPFPGFELSRAAIENAINGQGLQGDVINEDNVYQYLGYEIADVTSHGTHVMDIAAGNGQSLYATEGVAPEADIIFVQLPRVAVDTGGAALMESILDGAAYIFAKASELNRPAVVNISYGAHLGPHDGTSQIESGLDELLALPTAQS